MARITSVIAKFTKAKSMLDSYSKMSGNDCRTSMSLVCDRNMSGRRRQAVPDDGCKTGNERQPTVAIRYAENCSRCDELADPGMAKRHDRNFVVDQLWYTQPVEDCKGVSNVVVASKPEHHTSCRLQR